MNTSIHMCIHRGKYSAHTCGPSEIVADQGSVIYASVRFLYPKGLSTSLGRTLLGYRELFPWLGPHTPHLTSWTLWGSDLV